MNKVKIFYLLILLPFLASCDPVGCIQAGEFGNLTVKAADLYANPYTSNVGTLRSEIIATCREGCSSADGTCSSHDYWTPINSAYDSGSSYSATIKGNVSFCSDSDSTTSTTIGTASLISRLYASITNYSSQNSDGSYNSYADGSSLSLWYDVTGNSKNAIQEDIFPIAVSSTATLTSNHSDGSSYSQTLTLGNYATLDANIAGDIDEVSVPSGCKMTLYNGENFTNFSYDLTSGIYTDIQSAKYSENTCTSADSLTFYYNDTLSYIRAGNSYDPELGSGGSSYVNDKITGFLLPAGCAVDIWRDANYSHSYTSSTIYPGETIFSSSDERYKSISSYKAKGTGSNYVWQGNISSVKLEDDGSGNCVVTSSSLNSNSSHSSASSETPNSTSEFSFSSIIENAFSASAAISSNDDFKPKIKSDIFGTDLDGVYFDGTDDFMDFSSAASAFTSNYVLFMLVKDASGTILNLTDSSASSLERFYVENGILKYDYDGTNIFSTSGSIPSIALISVIRNGTSFRVKINSYEDTNNLAPALSSFHSNLTEAYIGAAFEPGAFSDPYSGYIGLIQLYSGSMSDTEVTALERNFMIAYDMLSCASGKHYEQIRLRIGDYDEDTSVFNSAGDLTIPSSYSSKTGSMYFRLVDPYISAGSCMSDTDQKDLLADNIGSLEMNVKISTGTNTISNLYDYFVLPIEQFIAGDGASKPGIQQVFFTQLFSSGSVIIFIVQISLVFYITFFAAFSLAGMIDLKLWDFILRIFKMAIIITLISSSSWDFFYDFIIRFFRGGSQDIVNMILGLSNSEAGLLTGDSDIPARNMFIGLDSIMGMFLSSDVSAKVLALLFAPPFLGMLMVMMFYYAFYIFVSVISKVLMVHLSIFIMMTFAFLVAPIFWIFGLFSRTKSLYTKWLDLVVGYAVQYICMAVVVGFFSWIILAVFVDLLGYTVCWRPVLFCCDSTPATFTLLEFFSPASFDYPRFSSDVKEQYVPDIWGVGLFLFIVYLFKQFFDFMLDFGTTLAGGAKISAVSNALSKKFGAHNLLQTAKDIVNNVVDRTSGALNVMSGGRVEHIRKATGRMEDFAQKQTMGRIQRAVGERSPEEQEKIDAIKKGVQEGRMNAAKNGGDKEEEIKKSVRANLEKIGKGDPDKIMTEKQIEKVMKSGQLNRDVKFSRLQTSEVKGMMEEEFHKKYGDAKKAGASDEDATKQARAHLDQIKINVGKTLRQEAGIEKTREAESKGLNDYMNFKYKDSDGVATKAVKTAGNVLTAAPLVNFLAGGEEGKENLLMAKARNKIGKLRGDSVEKRLENFARMSGGLEQAIDDGSIHGESKHGKIAQKLGVADKLDKLEAIGKGLQQVGERYIPGFESDEKKELREAEAKKFKFDYEEGSISSSKLESQNSTENETKETNDLNESKKKDSVLDDDGMIMRSLFDENKSSKTSEISDMEEKLSDLRREHRENVIELAERASELNERRLELAERIAEGNISDEDLDKLRDKLGEDTEKFNQDQQNNYDIYFDQIAPLAMEIKSAQDNQMSNISDGDVPLNLNEGESVVKDSNSENLAAGEQTVLVDKNNANDVFGTENSSATDVFGTAGASQILGGDSTLFSSNNQENDPAEKSDREERLEKAKRRRRRD